MTRAFVALGANLPFAGRAGADLLEAALAEISAEGWKIAAVSGAWETAPWPPSDQPAYTNAVAVLDAVGAAPGTLFASLRRVEAAFGRERRARWDARTLDLDIVAIDGWVGDFGDVTLPHKRMHERAFVLAPLADVAPDWTHPLLGVGVAALLAGLPPGQSYRRLRDLRAA